MKKFRFPLEGLERVREMQVKEVERELQVAASHVRRTQEVLSRRRQLLEHSNRERPSSDPRALHLWEEGRAHLREEIRRLGEQKAMHVEAMNEVKTRLAEAEKQRAVVERIREQKKVEYLREVMRDEQRDMDEIAGQMHEKERKAA